MPQMSQCLRILVSVQLELVLVNDLERRILILLSKDRVPDDEQVELRSHETSERILRRADDGLAAYVEARVDHHRAAGQGVESADKVVIEGFVSRCTVCTRAE